MNKKTILVTGGAGYIGSHTCVALCKAGYKPLVLDNLSNSTSDVLERVEAITQIPLQLIEGDIRDRGLLDEIFKRHACSGVIHFAGLKAVGESMSQPLKYYDVNVTGSLTLLQAMQHAGVKKLIFSSSAAVYGAGAVSPIKETALCATVNPYGRSKLMIEEVLKDLQHAASHWSIARLRYFNPIGAHSSGLIGEAPQGEVSNVMPYITQVAVGLRERLSIFGNDYPTPDGTALRDYIHVMDLAEGHVAALQHGEKEPGMATINLGTGIGTSVLQLVEAFEKASGKKIPYEISPRRAGDVAACWADPTVAEELLGWKAIRNIETMCLDAWNWQQGKN